MDLKSFLFIKNFINDENNRVNMPWKNGSIHALFRFFRVHFPSCYCLDLSLIELKFNLNELIDVC